MVQILINRLIFPDIGQILLPARCVSSNRAESQETIQVLPFNYQGGQIEQNGSLVIGQDEIGKWNSIIQASSHHREPPAT
ncbi:hypothetical protein VTP01DRAFT_5646 [Rhizomucor pusillus]|uniref:uncharacterized protein n=1 Tax=Rhizomucor pusillus TaxID=4840 RepID=UPI003743DA31